MTFEGCNPPLKVYVSFGKDIESHVYLESDEIPDGTVVIEYYLGSVSNMNKSSFKVAKHVITKLVTLQPL